jgi:NADP-dependent 3-hydroxy acid dehydrogenase YdfG
MKQNLHNHASIVTGASSGIGKATAEKPAEEGSNIVLAYLSVDRLEELADHLEESHGIEAVAVETDVTEKEQVEKMIETVVEKFGGLDIVVNNAGLGLGGDVESMEDSDFHTMMDVNCDGMFFTARAALPHLKESNASIIFLGSIAGQYPRAPNPVYAATKAWTRSFSKSLSAQIGDEGVAVTVVNPSEVRTEFASESGSSFAERFEEGEVTEPEDIADSIVFAAKQEEPNTVSEIDLYRHDKLGDMI